VQFVDVKNVHHKYNKTFKTRFMKRLKALKKNKKTFAKSFQTDWKTTDKNTVRGSVVDIQLKLSQRKTLPILKILR